MTITKIPEGYKLVPKDKMTARMFDAAFCSTGDVAMVIGD